MQQDDLPQRRPKGLEQRALDPMSVEDLTAYIGELRDEIRRVEAAIEHRQGHRAAADKIFKL